MKGGSDAGGADVADDDNIYIQYILKSLSIPQNQVLRDRWEFFWMFAEAHRSAPNAHEERKNEVIAELDKESAKSSTLL